MQRDRQACICQPRGVVCGLILGDFFGCFVAMAMLDHWQTWARTIKRDVHALYLARRDPRVPWYAKLLAMAVVAYALSPIDLIPDFIPVLGYLDDLIIVPLGILLVVRLIPAEVMAEHRALADAAQDRPVSRGAAVFVIAVWIAAVGLVLWMVWKLL